MSIFVLPDLGEGLQEAELVAWHVGEGDHVVADQPLVSVETEKAVVEVPSPQAGKIARLCVQPGDSVKVGGAAGRVRGGPADRQRHDRRRARRSRRPQPFPSAAPPTPAVRAAPAVRALGAAARGRSGGGRGERTRRRA